MKELKFQAHAFCSGPQMAREREELMAELVAGSISKATQVAVEEREDERARHPAGAQEAAKHVPESLAECKRKAMRPAVPEFRRTVERRVMIAKEWHGVAWDAACGVLA